MNKVRRFLVKKDKPGYVYNYTEALAERDDMYECDIKGNILSAPGGMPVVPTKTGITLPPIGATESNPEPTSEENKTDNVDSTDEPTKDTGPITAVDFGGTRTDMIAQAKELYGGDADYIKGNWSRTAIMDEIKKLASARELKGE